MAGRSTTATQWSDRSGDRDLVAQYLEELRREGIVPPEKLESAAVFISTLAPLLTP